MKDTFNELRKSSTDTSNDWDGDCSNGIHFRKCSDKEKMTQATSS